MSYTTLSKSRSSYLLLICFFSPPLFLFIIVLFPIWIFHDTKVNRSISELLNPKISLLKGKTSFITHPFI